MYIFCGTPYSADNFIPIFQDVVLRLCFTSSCDDYSFVLCAWHHAIPECTGVKPLPFFASYVFPSFRPIRPVDSITTILVSSSL